MTDRNEQEPLAEQPGIAGGHLVSRVLSAPIQASVGDARGELTRGEYDSLQAVYLVDGQDRLAGLVPLTRLFAEPDARPLAEIALIPAPSVHAGTDQEHVASYAIQHGLTAVPIVDAHERLLGVMPALALLEVLRHEHVEDLHRLAGIASETTRARHAIEAPPVRRARDRLPWLLVGLAGSMLATFVVAGFEEALQAKVAIAFFVPGIVYLADAVGTQSEAIAVRGLSLSRMPLRHALAGELRTGVLIGLTLGLLALFPIWLVFGEFRLAAAVSIALFVASAVATTIGFAFPWILAHLGKDPAFGSGPVATIIQDVLSLLIYFATVSLLAL